ncbi:Bug family tripartite tricarboxylate transporter substrate binding protein [Roseococcus suduntuyensis]|uniref:Tripartite-type tricarboxylate transporter receptor subunit TctC n=1 Tax=Roseococcus suduntuyensis TaxID=455361 RepID=A0A840AET1_9PROT|nr:tripartite tricarboxylate transporter substrate-binding protein [Roseococcus suduntuyensis]MBB3900398.1 tripartite-type tricarboxylate transporter receptor subunit TctC [Roseococcus suduntuyensis]
MRLPRRRFVLPALGLALAAPAVQAQAAWPRARPIRLVVGFPPGGSGDFLARIFAEMLGRALDQVIVVDNRPGAAATIAATHVARSAPDGYTILLGGSGSQAISPALYAAVNFDPVRDFTPITRLTDLTGIIAARPQLGIGNLAQLIERVRAEPGRWNFGTPGNGTPWHLAGATLARLAGIQLTHVPFRGGGASLHAALAGDVELLVGTPPVLLPAIRTERMRGLSLTSREASRAIPDVPGTAEAGLPSLDVAGWWGFFAPAGLPDEIRDKLFEVSVAAVSDTDVQARIATEGLQAWPSRSPTEFAEFMGQQIPFWAELVRTAGARSE